MNRYVLSGAVVLAMCAAPAFAQTTATSGATKTKANATSSMKTTTDQKFVREAAAGGMAEVELGNLAQQKASNEEVKSFGKRMVDDHGKANNELKTLAQNKNITLPSDLTAKDKALKDRLEKLSGPAFDRAYMQAMVQDHKKDVNEFRHESTSAQDPDVKQFAAKTLPTLEDHLKMAEDANKAVGTSGTMTKKNPK
jgi:putative membrane protein